MTATTTRTGIASIQIEGLKVAVEGKEILTGLDLAVAQGETHAIMGPNGSGKSTLAYAIAGHPAYQVTGGTIRFDGEDVTQMSPDERAAAGLFLAMQYPTEIPGVSLTNFLRTAVNATSPEDIPVRQFMTTLRELMAELKMDGKFLERNVNEGFSGGEKKRFEILQMAMLKPRIAVLDETDSGLDVDALKVVSEGVNRLQATSAEEDRPLGILLITHYTRILGYINADQVHVMAGGRIVKTGGPDLAETLEAEGYEQFEG